MALATSLCLPRAGTGVRGGLGAEDVVEGLIDFRRMIQVE